MEKPKKTENHMAEELCFTLRSKEKINRMESRLESRLIMKAFH